MCVVLVSFLLSFALEEGLGAAARRAELPSPSEIWMSTPATETPREDRILRSAIWVALVLFAIAIVTTQLLPAKAEHAAARAVAEELAERADELEAEVNRRARRVRALDAGDSVAIRDVLQREGFIAPGRVRVVEAPR